MSLPTKNADLLGALRANADKITAAPADYGLTADQALALANAVTAAETTDADANTYDTLKQSKVNAAQTAAATAETLYRSYANMARHNPAVTDEKLADIGESRRSMPSRIGAPADAPVLSVESLGIGQATVRCDQPASRGTSLPVDATGIELSLVNGTTPVTDSEADNGNSTFVTRCRPTIDTNIGFARLRVYARYIGRRAQPGPWSLPVQFSPPQP
jgi:hypothetical protein